MTPADQSAQALTSYVKDEALRLGFSKVGVARAETLLEEGDRLGEWLARGYHASMGWMARTPEKRSDPDLVLPGVRSIVSVALNYHTGGPHPDDPSVGKISRYAWGDDYHAIVLRRLELLMTAILARAPGARGKVYVDTGPVMEKAWAERAGIGWRGKHTNVITKEYGSWVFLGELLLTVPLIYDAPAVDHCGTCTLCIEACPTDAIVAPYVVDSNACISYLTIEHRGDIARELGERFDRWIYGCDICQDVCPWNHRFTQGSTIQEFQARPVNERPTLDAITTLTDAKFSEQYRNSPMKRTKRSGLVRNARVALPPGHLPTPT
jgi:epoxyqueuosine reductase